jgi:SAM-dependent methyltransferase
MIDLKTTTRPRRHAGEFRELRRFLAAPSSGRPLEVANVGPGLAVRYFGRLSAADIPGWDFFRRIESGIRRIPMPDAFYENYETAELIAALGDVPFNLTLVDINPRVVRVVERNTPGRKVDHVLVDLGEARSVRLAPYRGKFDVVVAFAVIGRVKDRLRENARDNVRSLLRPGGILVSGGDIVTEDFTPLSAEHGLFRRALPVGQGST